MTKNQKMFLATASAIFVEFIILVLAGAFVTGEIDPMKWDMAGRGIVVACIIFLSMPTFWTVESYLK